MAFINLKYIKYFYLIICILATVCLSVFSIHRYLSNEDTTLVKITKFASSKDAIYPAFSFCIFDPFLKEKFDIYQDEKINMTSYVKFLKGELWDDRMLIVEYESVTVSLSESLTSAGFVTISREVFDWNVEHYVSFQSPERKCFTIIAPIQEQSQLYYSWFSVNYNIFPSGKRSNRQKIFMYLHYPGQRLSEYTTLNSKFNLNNTKNYRMKFELNNIDVMTRRNKVHEPCIEKWQEYDFYFMQNWQIEVGCRPPQWTKQNDLPVCSKAIQMQNFSREPLDSKIDSFDPPCKVIDQLDYTYQEYSFQNKG